jgi:methionyl-tRNA formyltransferase
MGTPEAAVPCLFALVTSRHPPAAVVCQPDRPAGRGRALHAPPVKRAALELGLPVLQPESTRGADVREAIRAHAPEILVVVAYGRILGARLLAVAPRGAVNVHFSLLPRWRGAAPVQRAILAGDVRTGVSTMAVTETVDAGPVYLQEETAIGPDEHAPALEARLAELGAALLVRTLDGLAAGTLPARPQDEGAATLAPPLVKAEAWLDLREPAAVLARAVRALDPWPGARVRAGGIDVLVLDAVAGTGGTEASPGVVLPLAGDGLPVACGGGTVLLVRSARPAGRAAMDARSLVNGRHLAPGDVLDVATTPGPTP